MKSKGLLQCPDMETLANKTNAGIMMNPPPTPVTPVIIPEIRPINLSQA